VHNRREPQGHLSEKNGTWKFCYEVLRNSLEFPEKYSWEILRNLLRKISEKFSGISRNLFSYLIPLKIRKLSDQNLKISLEFPEKHSRKFLRNFLRWNSGEIPRNFSKLIILLNGWPSPKNFSGISRNWVSKLWSHKNLSSWGPILGNFLNISKELVTENDSWEIPRKFFKESHHDWRIWGNSSLWLLGNSPIWLWHCYRMMSLL